MSEQLNDRLTKMLKSRNMSQKDLADKSDTTQSSISHYLKGDRVPTSDTIYKLADALGTTTDYLLSGEPFTEDEKLNKAVDTVIRYAEHLSYDQKVQVVSAMLRQK